MTDRGWLDGWLNLYYKICHVRKVNFVRKLENGVDRFGDVGGVVPSGPFADLSNSVQNFVAARRHELLGG